MDRHPHLMRITKGDGVQCRQMWLNKFLHRMGVVQWVGLASAGQTTKAMIRTGLKLRFGFAHNALVATTLNYGKL